jgi:RNA ligase (TIGR02306 family)
MSTFAVTVRKIEKVWKHPGADRLDIAQIDGSDYQFVVGRGEYGPGDEVVYFPIDSLLPQQITDAMGLTGKLSGKGKNRIKTIKLRNEISQGLVARRNLFLGPNCKSDFMLAVCPTEEWRKWTPDELTKAFGVTKYEPTPIYANGGNLVGLPDGVSFYDIEGAENHPDVVELLMDRICYISEKIEGSNWWASIGPEASDVVCVGCRHHKIELIENVEHQFHAVAKQQGLLDYIRNLRDGFFPGKQVTIYGEFHGIGVQGNIYGLKEKRICLFDILVDHKFIDPTQFLDLTIRQCTGDGKPLGPVLTVPLLAITTLRKWLNGRTLRDASHGMSLFGDTIREGVVIKPMTEETHPEVGRLFVKQRDPIYLAGTEN